MEKWWKNKISGMGSGGTLDLVYSLEVQTWNFSCTVCFIHFSKIGKWQHFGLSLFSRSSDLEFFLYCMFYTF